MSFGYGFGPRTRRRGAIAAAPMPPDPDPGPDGMLVHSESFSTSSQVSGISLPVPEEAEEDDVVVWFFMTPNKGPDTPSTSAISSDLTFVAGGNRSSMGTRIWYRIIDKTEPSEYTGNWLFGNGHYAVCAVVLRGADLADPIPTNGSYDSFSGDDEYPSPALTVDRDGSVLFHLAAQNGSEIASTDHTGGIGGLVANETNGTNNLVVAREDVNEGTSDTWLVTMATAGDGRGQAIVVQPEAT